MSLSPPPMTPEAVLAQATRALAIEAQALEALRARLGDDCLDELTRIRTWLDTQPRREELLALLRAGW